MMKKRRISWDAPYSHAAPGWVIAHHQELDDNNIAAMCINFAVAAFILCGPGDVKMAWVDRQTIGQLKSMVDSSYDLTSLLTLMLASSPPGALSPKSNGCHH